ncbi:NAD(P)-dependent oxidoreductase [Alphaproteobacteria bacterium KMM 3653]|uniref:NAD(P)-dependent oxidoreductase n=1 Tax=Harenicola maris TaxID=2841044 RepID=A0AAP2G9U5_9RHOB|nr:NAD(P)-dependent oxidoreductase [Harenicola maris]
MTELPTHLSGETELEEIMTRPTAELISDLQSIDGDIMILGVAGKMGLTLARMAKRAAPDKRVIGVARFSAPGSREGLEAIGVETVACDLLDRAQIEALEPVKNVLFMAGRKFGAAQDQPATWAMNAYVPALVAERFKDSRIIAFSTACVYALSDVEGSGSIEEHALTPPGEYANSCVGRERMFEYFSAQHRTPGRLFRLCYAIDMRYGVLHDIATAVWNDQPVSLAMSHANVLWQGDANAIALRLLAHCTVPSSPINVSGPEKIEIRKVAEEFGRLFGKEVSFTGRPEKSAWLVNTKLQQSMFGKPTVGIDQLIGWTADWVQNDRGSLGKPTHFEVRDGTY